jgi:hypothetical protein
VTVSNESRAAQRFPIKASLRYRRSATTDWFDATTENMSASGLFFRAAQFAECGMRVDIELVLRANPNQAFGAQVIGHGEIVRSEPLNGTGRLSGLAVKLLDYRLLRWEGTDQQGRGLA